MMAILIHILLLSIILDSTCLMSSLNNPYSHPKWIINLQTNLFIIIDLEKINNKHLKEANWNCIMIKEINLNRNSDFWNLLLQLGGKS